MLHLQLALCDASISYAVRPVCGWLWLVYTHTPATEQLGLMVGIGVPSQQVLTAAEHNLLHTNALADVSDLSVALRFV